MTKRSLFRLIFFKFQINSRLALDMDKPRVISKISVDGGTGYMLGQPKRIRLSGIQGLRTQAGPGNSYSEASEACQ